MELNSWDLLDLHFFNETLRPVHLFEAIKCFLKFNIQKNQLIVDMVK